MNEKKGNEAVSVETQVNSISERKREANRLNALRSTGPKSETGKSRSRWNAMKHGVLAKEVPGNHAPYFRDDLWIFEELLKELIKYFDPVGPLEKMLVERIVQCCWRRRRIQLAENAEIRVALIEESCCQARQDDGSEEEGGPKSEEIFKKARTSIDSDGYVAAPLQEAIFKEGYWTSEKDEFVTANEKAENLARKWKGGPKSLELESQIKKSRSTLLRRLGACEQSSQLWNDGIKDIRQENRAARYAQHLVLDDHSMSKFLRYEAANDRQLCDATAELERLQCLRLGKSVSAPLEACDVVPEVTGTVRLLLRRADDPTPI